MINESTQMDKHSRALVIHGAEAERFGPDNWESQANLKQVLSFTFRSSFQGEMRILNEANYQNQERGGEKFEAQVKHMWGTKELFDMQTQNQDVALKDFSQGAGERCNRRKREGGWQTLPSFWSLETLELLWELHFRLRVIISRRQTTPLSALSFQQLANPDNIIEYMLPALTLHCLGCWPCWSIAVI